MTLARPASLAARIQDALPQTQCRRCGYADCAAYAQALSQGTAAINQCPPGGQEGVVRLAGITGQTVQPLNPAFGTEGPRGVAVIDEAWCIGCTLCIEACPVDAILGTHKRMHTVIETHCTGCELCLPACPVDCMHMEPVTAASGWAAWGPAEADKARARYDARTRRLQPRKPDALATTAGSAPGDVDPKAPDQDPAQPDRKRSIIEAALARARQKRESVSKT